jgi:hypothetical protein
VIDARQRDLAEIVLALGTAGGFAGGLDGGEEQRHQDADDGDYHQELDEGEGAVGRVR